jgi:hypothetical protein
MKDILNHLIEHRTLSKEQAKEVLKNIATGGYNQSQIAAFLTVYLMRSITVEELGGFREAMLELCVPVEIAEYDAMDLCGTGGDGKDTFQYFYSSFIYCSWCWSKCCQAWQYGSFFYLWFLQLVGTISDMSLPAILTKSEKAWTKRESVSYTRRFFTRP